MTKRVLVDARPLQVEAYATRGVGAHLRGWLNQASALQRQFDLEIALLLDRSAAVPPLPPFPRYFVRSSQHGCTCFAPDLMLRAEADLLEIAHVARADLVHVTYPLAEEFCPPGRLSCPSVVSLYDTILLDRAEAYLEAHLRQERAGFIQRIERLRLATRVQTLSRASAGDIARCLSPSPPPIDIVSCSVGDHFRPLPDRGASRIKQLGLPMNFVLTVTATHPSKNLSGLLQAFALLDLSLRQAFPLVVVARETPEQAERHQRLIAALGLQGQVFRLQHVSDEDLVALYNGAALLVCASLQEGFGMPVLEAMRCGTAVACSNLSSLPEVGGDAVAYFDPRLPADVAAVLTSLLTDAEQRDALGRAGLERSSRFNWSTVAASVLASYRQALEASGSGAKRALRATRTAARVAFWSPLPPVPSGISDYSESLLGAMSKHAVEVEVFTDGYQPDAAMRSAVRQALFKHFPVWDWRAFPLRHADQPFDACLFHFGNSPHHAYMLHGLAGLGRLALPTTLRRSPQRVSPCAVIGVFHDGSLHHLFAEGLSDRIARSIFQQERNQHIPQDLAAALLGPVVRACDGVIAHSHFVLERCRSLSPRIPARQIPFGMEPFKPTGEHVQRYLRQLLELPESGVIFGVFGHVHPVKRIDLLIQTWESDPPAGAWLYILGTVHDPSLPSIRRLLSDRRRCEASRIILRDSYLPYETLLLAMQAVDVGVNLRYPTHGETSAAVCSLLSMGKPVIASDVGAFCEFPDDCVLKVPVGEGERERLHELLHALALDASLRQRLGEAAQAFAAGRTWELVASEYLAFISEVCKRTGVS